MNNNTSFADQLEQFGKSQLAGVSTQDINASTVQLLLATVFFTGAAISLAKLSNTPKNSYLAILRTFLEDHFGLSSDRAAGMIESNARLYKRFVLIEKVYKTGWETARDWSQDSDKQSDELKVLLHQYRDLSMSDLSIEGTKEQKADKPAEVEKVTVTTEQLVVEETPTRWKPKALLITLLALIGWVIYAALYTDLFSTLIPTLESIFASIQDQISKLPIEEWVEKALSLIPK